MEDEILRYLKSKSDGTASSMEIITKLSLQMRFEDFDKIIESLYNKGLLFKIHEQHKSGKEPKYDLIMISDELKNE